MFALANKLTTPGESTKIRGVRVDESSTTAAMSNTGGSTNLNFEKKERRGKKEIFSRLEIIACISI